MVLITSIQFIYLLEVAFELQFACYLVQSTDSEILVSLLRQHQY